MKLEEAKNLLIEMRDNCLKDGKYNDPKRKDKAEAIETVLQEIETLQKSNAELQKEKEDLKTNLYRVNDDDVKHLAFIQQLQLALKNSISKEKIKDCLEDIEDYFENVSVPKEDIEFIKEKRNDLLKEE